MLDPRGEARDFFSFGRPSVPSFGTCRGAGRLTGDRQARLELAKAWLFHRLKSGDRA